MSNVTTADDGNGVNVTSLFKDFYNLSENYAINRYVDSSIINYYSESEKIEFILFIKGGFIIKIHFSLKKVRYENMLYYKKNIELRTEYNLDTSLEVVKEKVTQFYRDHIYDISRGELFYYIYTTCIEPYGYLYVPNDAKKDEVAHNKTLEFTQADWRKGKTIYAEPTLFKNKQDAEYFCNYMNNKDQHLKWKIKEILTDEYTEKDLYIEEK